MKQPVRVVLKSQTPGQGDLAIELAEGKPWFVVGRGAGVDLSLDDLTVGRRHCQFQLSGGQVKVQNLDHARGTWRNGMPIDDVDDLKEGDRVEIGDLVYQACIASSDSAAPATVSAPPPPPPPPTAVEPPPPPPPPVQEAHPDVPAEPPPAQLPAAEAVPENRPEAHPPHATRAAPPITRAGSVMREGSTTRPERSTVRMPPINPAARSSPPANPSRAATPAPTARNPSRVSPPRNPSRSTATTRVTRPAPVAETPPSSTPAEPAPPPTPPAAPVAVVSDAFTRNLIEDLEANFSKHTARYREGELSALIQRGRENAKRLGFAADEEVQQFIQCMVLLNDELTGQNAHNSDVWFTITSVNRPAAMRLKRALTISQRIGEQSLASGSEGASAVAPPPPPPPSVEPATPVETARIEPPPREERPIAEPAQEPRPTTPPPRLEPPPANEALRPSASPAPRHEPSSREAQREVAAPQIEGFEMLGRLGSGGMGDVYRARDVQLDVEVAIKILRSMHPTAQEQFQAEARAAAKLQHPNIVQVLRYGQIGDMGYYAMQLIQGRDAEQLLRSLREHVPQLKAANEIFSVCGIDPNVISPDLRNAANAPKPYYRIVAAWIAGVADGLERAHSMGVVHRDIKPDNMILASDGRMMLLDFGLAMRKSEERGAHANLCVGTPRYLSPEMLAAWAEGSGMAGTDERVDIWGLGSTLYEFLAFRPAYDGPVSRVLRDIATIDPTPPRECVWQVPEEIEAICLKALARNPEERYRRAAEMADELRRWLAGEAPAAAVDRANGGSKAKPAGIFSWLKKGK